MEVHGSGASGERRGSPWKRTAFRCIAVLAAIVLAAGGMQGFAVTASAEDMAGRTESMDGGGSTGQSGDVDDGTGAGVKTGGSDDISEPLFTEDFEGIAQDESASDGTRLQDYRSSWNGQDVRYAADGDRPNPEGCGDLRQPGTPGRGAAADRRPLRPGLAGRRRRHRRRDAVGRSLMRHMAHEAADLKERRSRMTKRGCAVCSAYALLGRVRAASARCARETPRWRRMFCDRLHLLERRCTPVYRIIRSAVVRNEVSP